MESLTKKKNGEVAAREEHNFWGVKFGKTYFIKNNSKKRKSSTSLMFGQF